MPTSWRRESAAHSHLKWDPSPRKSFLIKAEMYQLFQNPRLVNSRLELKRSALPRLAPTLPAATLAREGMRMSYGTQPLPLGSGRVWGNPARIAPTHSINHSLSTWLRPDSCRCRTQGRNPQTQNSQLHPDPCAHNCQVPAGPPGRQGRTHLRAGAEEGERASPLQLLLKKAAWGRVQALAPRAPGSRARWWAEGKGG